MNLLQLRYFYTVAKTLNISKSADIHHIPQPAMSRVISKMEKELDVLLFDRTKNHLALTSAGRDFLSEIEPSLRHLDVGLGKMNDYKIFNTGELHLAVLQHRLTVARCIADFSAIYPQISFYISHMETLDDNYDICISGEKPKNIYDSSSLLLNEEIGLAVPSNHPWAELSSVSLNMLRNESFIFHGKDSALTRLIMSNCRNLGFSPHINITCDDLYCIKEYILSGLGIGFFPKVAWKPLIDERIRYIPVTPEFYRSVNIYWNASSMSNPFVSQFLSCITETFQELAN